ncbi:hypothetical protein Tco_1509742 [Tanacetum coccineum]
MGKLDQVVAIVKSCSPNVIGDLTETMKDLSGDAFDTVLYLIQRVLELTTGSLLSSIALRVEATEKSPKPSKDHIHLLIGKLAGRLRRAGSLEVMRYSAIKTAFLFVGLKGEWESLREKADLTLTCQVSALLPLHPALELSFHI